MAIALSASSMLVGSAGAATAACACMAAAQRRSEALLPHRRAQGVHRSKQSSTSSLPDKQAMQTCFNFNTLHAAVCSWFGLLSVQVEIIHHEFKASNSIILNINTLWHAAGVVCAASGALKSAARGPSLDAFWLRKGDEALHRLLHTRREIAKHELVRKSYFMSQHTQ